ncbi:hypothetical protein A3H75_03265 [Candidatus Uhrbacteria bacterium RIFCSPLOWO2_02_FULL_51_9]|uniref:Polysaccharide chain length determinant N-terminal domain-containing protein n=1 Tax=Candidatus Uhrbacteria bacterium RIFCSPLOWO2_02_FULL_51_9 TaxID=1802410 RepID=A0A1F7VE62_9BACT|nr:MAG: hypothetical protein A3H75_03265 [Candidatus Uhrbacteria bacterium RIFCSPLOWO2_02_FULL_51_9]
MVLVGLLVAAMSGALSLLLPLQYRAETQVFILSRTPAGVDPFTLVKTAERIGANLSYIVYTSSFFDRVLTLTRDQIAREYFGANDREQRKAWRDSIDVGVVPGTGFLRVAAFHEDPRQAAILAQAVVTTLVDRGWEYVGGEVQIKSVDNVVISRFPVRPNILMNILTGFLIGVFGVALVELFRAPRHPHGGGGAMDWLRHV